MTTEELYFNGIRLDLAPNSIVGVTYQANNVGEAQDRQGDYSNQFRVPKTLRNRATLENMDNVNSATLIPYRMGKGRLVRDGIDIVREGIITIVSSSEQAYVLQLTSGNTSFFRPLQDVRVSNLPFVGVSHTNDFTTILASRSNTTGFIYPLIDWFDDSKNDAFTDLSSTGGVDAEYLMPCIFFKDVIAACEQLTGYTVKGSFINSPQYPNIIVTPNALKRSDEQKKKYTQFSTNTTDDAYTGTGATVVQWDVFGYGFDGQNYLPDNGIYGYMTFRGSLSFTNPLLINESGAFRFRILRNGIEVFAEDAQPFIAGPGETITVFFDAVSVNRVFDSADTYYATIEPIGIAGFPTFTLEANSKWTFELLDNMPYGSIIDTNELYEDLFVKDLLQDVLNQNGILVQTNSFRGEVYFDFFDDILGNIQTAEDCSKLVDVGPFSLNYKFGKYGKVNEFRYADEDTVPDETGNASFLVDDQTLPDRVKAIELKTSATEEELRYQNETFPRIRSIDYTLRTFSETNFRILILNRKNTAYPVKYFDGLGSSDEITDSVPFCSFSPLSFENLINTRYVTLRGILRKTKAVTIPIRWTNKHIQELNYLKPIFLDVHTQGEDINGYFYINKIGPYVSGRSTSTELLRL